MNNVNGQISIFGETERKITDFGEHIGGARKEMFSAKGLSLGDIMDMNAAEKTKFVKKQNIWPKPDYNKMVAEGLPVIVAYAIKQVRDALPAKPYIWHFDTAEKIVGRQENYISYVSLIRDRVSAAKTTDDFLKIQNTILEEILDAEKSGPYIKCPISAYEGLLNDKTLKALTCGKDTFSRTYPKMIRIDQFGVSEDEKVPKGWKIEFYNGTGWSRPDWEKDTYRIVHSTSKCMKIVEFNIPTYEQALEKARTYAKDSRKSGKAKFIPPQLEHVRRTGFPDVRGDRDISGNDFLQDFKIRGGEFGNWMSGDDAQTSLNMAYEAFCDFADILDIPLSGVSFGGRLAVAFGARGMGSAVAHYESMREVINITKMRGAGSLGHELFHAMDDIVGKKLGIDGFLTESLDKRVPESMRKVTQTMCYRKMTKEEINAEKEKDICRQTKRLQTLATRLFPVSELNTEQQETRESLLANILEDVSTPEMSGDICKISWSTKAIDAFSDYKKEALGRVIPKDSRKELFWAWSSLASAKTKSYENMRVESEYYKNSKRMDQKKAKEKNGYWSSLCEMFARAGACYLTDMAREKGGVSDYLSGHSESCIDFDVMQNGETEIIRAMPQGEERKSINEAIKAMIDDFKERGLM